METMPTNSLDIRPSSLDLAVLDGGQGRVEDPVGAGRGGGRERAPDVRLARRETHPAGQLQDAVRFALNRVEFGAAVWQSIPVEEKGSSLITNHWQKPQVRRFSDCCSADFGHPLPANQLYNNQKMDELET